MLSVVTPIPYGAELEEHAIEIGEKHWSTRWRQPGPENIHSIVRIGHRYQEYLPQILSRSHLSNSGNNATIVDTRLHTAYKLCEQWAE